MKQTSIVWFTTNLRLHDNEPLYRALQENDCIIPVYNFDDLHYRTTSLGFQKTGPFRKKFIEQSVYDLAGNLGKLGSGLVIDKGDTVIKIVQLAKQYNCKHVYTMQEFAPEELSVQHRLRTALKRFGISLKTYPTGMLYTPSQLPFSISNTPAIFTGYRKLVEKHLLVPGFCKPPAEVNPLCVPGTSWSEIKEIDGPVCADPRQSIAIVGGETAALNRLQEYLYESRAILHYKETRNELSGKNYSSKFSAWLAAGCISPRKIYHEIKAFESQFGANDSTGWLVFELLWRDYFKLVMLQYGAQLFAAGGIKQKPQKETRHSQQLLQQWIEGQTGKDFVDANMLELKYTGYMSNRGRQVVASYLCNDLHLDWRYGAAYFEQQLIDYDVCSNYGNWAYIAGVGNDPRPNRYFNIEKQAETYDPQHSYRNLWLQQ